MNNTEQTICLYIAQHLPYTIDYKSMSNDTLIVEKTLRNTIRQMLNANILTIKSDKTVTINISNNDISPMVRQAFVDYSLLNAFKSYKSIPADAREKIEEALHKMFFPK